MKWMITSAMVGGAVLVLAGCGRKQEPATAPAGGEVREAPAAAVEESIGAVLAETEAAGEKVEAAAATAAAEATAAVEDVAAGAGELIKLPDDAKGDVAGALTAEIEKALAAKDYQAALAKVQEALKLPDLADAQKEGLAAKLEEIKKLLAGDAAAEAAKPAEDATKAAAGEATKAVGGLLK